MIWRLGLAIVLSVLTLAGCASRRITLPVDPGTPLPDFAEIHAQVSAACIGVRTLTAELALSGRAGGQRLRGRLHAGFERPASMRLEAVAPFGPPVFILAVRDGEATLLLPRELRVVRDEPAEAILGALTGVTLAPADLQAILTGCVSADPRPVAGRRHRDGWASIDLDDGATLYLRSRGQLWEVRAGRRGPWQIEYADWQGRFPRTVRLRSEPEDVPVNVAATLTQLAINVGLDPAAFSVVVPPAARPLALDELREAGPLAEP